MSRGTFYEVIDLAVAEPEGVEKGSGARKCRVEAVRTQAPRLARFTPKPRSLGGPAGPGLIMAGRHPTRGQSTLSL